MTEDDKTGPEEKSVERMKITPVVPLHQMPDVNLAAVAGFAYFVGFPVTLYMPWGIVAGTTAAPNHYYQHLGDSVRGGIPPVNAPEGWQKLMDQFAEMHFDHYADITYEEWMKNNVIDGFDMISHAVIKDARCWLDLSSTPVQHEYLRVRLTDVTAWAWGAINVD